MSGFKRPMVTQSAPEDLHALLNVAAEAGVTRTPEAERPPTEEGRAAETKKTPLKRTAKAPEARKPQKAGVGQGATAKTPKTASESKSATPAMPWDDMDDKALRTQGYTVNFPASVYAKLKFLGEHEPGGPSIRQMVLDALTPYIDERLAKHLGEKA